MSNETNTNNTDDLQLPCTSATSLEIDEQPKNYDLSGEPKTLLSRILTSDDAEVKTLSGSLNQLDSEQVIEPEGPARFDEIIPLIAQSINAGFVCFLNPDTLELEQVSGKMIDNPEAFYASTGLLSRRKPFNHLLWNNCMMFEPVPNSELLPVLDNFVLQLTDHPFRDKLGQVMKKRTSYAKIDAYLNKSKHSAAWTEYKLQYIEKHVSEKLFFLLNDCLELF